MLENKLSKYINLKDYPIDDINWRNILKDQYKKTGLISLPCFLSDLSIKMLQDEGLQKLKNAYFNPQKHNVYLKPNDDTLPDNHPSNFLVTSSKGCITDDIISGDSPLRIIYNSMFFKDFLIDILHLKEIYPYADNLSSINIHYARKGEELGWHFDNSSFAITLMIKPSSEGGIFQYTEKIRIDGSDKEKEFQKVSDILNNDIPVNSISMIAGGLLLFNGKNSMHRVTKVIGDDIRILAVLAYNQEKGISLSKSAQKTFYGKVAK